MKEFFRQAWQTLRRMTGDDAYERYVVHHHAQHPDSPLLDRAAFFRSEQQRKWDGVRRCC